MIVSVRVSAGTARLAARLRRAADLEARRRAVSRREDEDALADAALPATSNLREPFLRAAAPAFDDEAAREADS